MAKNFYNLPPSWNPGYAMPESVMDEGLERRAFVTAMLPRGTYDDSTGQGGGYATPAYIDDETPGQGARTTKWLPRGYYGPSVPAWLDQRFSEIVGEKPASGRGVVLEMATMSGLGGFDAYASSPAHAQRLGPWIQYGRRSAAIMIDQAKRLPSGPQREAALKTMMAAIDPTLESRAKALGERARALGATPSAALAHGLAAAMSEGMLREIFELGRTGRRPAARSRLGLGYYGCAAALGAVIPQDTNAVSQIANKIPAKYSSNIANAMTNQIEAIPVLEVGPWKLSTEPNVSTQYEIKSLNNDQKASISKGLTKIIVKAQMFADSDARINLEKGLGWPQSPAKVPISALNGREPFFAFTHPTTKKRCGLVLVAGGGNPAHASAAEKQNPTIMLSWREWPDKSLWEILLSLPAKLTQIAIDLGQAGIDSIRTAIDGVRDQGCQVVNMPGASTAAGVVGGVYGGPAGAAAGVQGTNMAQAGCNASGTQQQLPPPPPETNLTMPLLLLGGGAALVLLLNRKKASH